jgi:hypothetical protein
MSDQHNELHLQMQTPAPPDRIKQLEQTIRKSRDVIEATLKLLNAQPDETPTASLIAALTSAMRQMDAQVDDLETQSHYMNADNEELRMVAGKLRKQRDEAIKARNQVLAYLRQRKINV